ncbi:AMP-binding protein [Streptomyces otsuchiensis]|uniref:AMP-binding protein n=1 Tax=Streptomyces otsuchiensis TaxID=2681388 RepID=UPI00102F86AF|nr:AMP-binding protein [Streptomyces otsuchiensis]
MNARRNDPGTPADPHPGLWEALLGGSRRGTLHAWEGDRFTRSGWAEVSADAHAMAGTLRAAGVVPGTRVAAVLTNTPHAVRGLLAAWIAGAAVASLPLPARGMTAAEYGAQLGALLGRVDPTVLLTDETLLPLTPAEVTTQLPVLTWSSLEGGPGGVDPSPPGPDEVAFIQCSSGSTSVPKGCALTPRAIAAQLGMMLEMAGSTPGREVIGCWLPLSHDMGAFGCLLNAWAYDFDLVLSTPERFSMAPRSWFRDLSEYGATMTAGTSTALHLATRAQSKVSPLPRELALRVLVMGAERVDWDTITAATERFAPSGLRPEAFMPAYGLAEATLAVSCTPYDQRPRAGWFERTALLEGRATEAAAGAPDAVRLVSNGPSLPGVEITAGAPGTSAELLISSPSLATHYYGDPERTAQRFTGGRLRTGDLGFEHEGEIYVAGRADDLLSVGGRKIYAAEIESALDALGPLRKGSSVLLDTGRAGTPELVLLTEPRRRRDDFRAIADDAAALARGKAGVALAECWFLEHGVVPRTPSGKVQRNRCRALLGEERLRAIARVRLG